tara:strand:- start:727 stop:1092 length:366 start_codon:yes stop_codon:yes gene_type:complete
MGVWFTKDEDYAGVYAKALREKGGNIEILRVEIPDNLKIADLYSVEKKAKNPNDATRARWEFLGYNVDDMESMQPVRDLQPFATTKLLVRMGYDGAMIPNTIYSDGEPELVVFDPKNVKLA